MSTLTSDSVSKNIVQTLLYFDIFNYPLESGEVFQFLQTNHVTPEIIHKKLHDLCEEKITFRFGNFFTVQNDASLIERRERGNKEALKFMPLALKQATMINKFPFVRAVFASGSLSKGYMDHSCDLDFFIVTKTNRLWIARTFLVLYKRLFLANSHKYFCVNYFIDEDNLEIEEKNLYTATELITLIPLAGRDLQKRLLDTNQWVKDYLPNSHIERQDNLQKTNSPVFKTILEGLMNVLFPKALNLFLMKLTMKRWERLYIKKYSSDDFKVAFKTNPNVSKNHPNYYQKKVINLYKEKSLNFSAQYDLNWES